MAKMVLKPFFSETNARIGARYRNAGPGIVKGMLDLEERQIKNLQDKAKRLSGRTAYKVGSQRPGPYGWNAKNKPPTKLEEANIQSGEMQKGWSISRRYSKSGATFTLYNKKDYSRFFAGDPTSKMQARPLLQNIIGQDLDKLVTEGRIQYNEYVKRFWTGK